MYYMATLQLDCTCTFTTKSTIPHNIILSCVFVGVCVRACVCIYVRACVCAYVCVREYVRACVSGCVSVNVCARVCDVACTRKYVCVTYVL